MADFFRGLQGGFQTGLQLGAQLRQRRQEEALANAYGLPVQEQQAALATPEQIGRAQAETQALAAQDAEMFGLAPQDMQRYAPAMPQEGMRVGPSTYRIGEETFQRAPTQAQIDAARTRAAANVYGQLGDTARREELLRGLRAEERATAAEGRAVSAEQRAAQGFTTQQQEAGLRIAALERQQKEIAGNEAARKALTELRANNQPVTSQTLAELARTHGANYNALLDDEIKQLGFTSKTLAAETENLQKQLSRAMMGGIPSMNKFLADKFDPNKSDNITPEIVQTKNGMVVMYGGRVLSEYGTHKNLNELVAGVNGIIAGDPLGAAKTLADLRYKESAAEANRATTQLRGLQGRAVREQTAATAEAARIRAEYEALTPEEQAGAKGQGLIRQFNMANVKAGATVPLGATTRAREVSNADVINLSKELVGKQAFKADGTPVLQDGKPVRYTQETALTAARAMLEQQPTTAGLPTWGAGGAAAPQRQGLTQTPPTAAPAAAPAPSRAAPRVDPLSLQIDKETEEMAMGRRAAYSPEVQAALNARSAARQTAEQRYLQREQSLATGPGLWR